MRKVTYEVIRTGKTSDRMRVVDSPIPAGARYEVRRCKSEDHDESWYMFDWQWKEGVMHLGLSHIPSSSAQLEALLRQLGVELEDGQ